MPKPTARNTAPPELVARARALTDELGTTAAAKALGISTEAFARLVGGLGVRRGTVALALQAFATLDAAKGEA